jgi:arginine repressor
MFFRAKKSGSKHNPHHYLQIVESYRDGRSVRQRVIATVGRLDHLKAAGQIDGLVKSLARFSETLRVISAARDPKITTCKAKSWGPSLIFDRLWQQQGLPELIRSLASGRKFHFDLERAVFALSLQRLCEPGSDLQGSQWLQTMECPGFDKLELQHLYRTNGFLHDIRHDLEEQLYFRDLNLFNQQLDLIFLDTTSTYVYRDEESEYRKRGYSRDRRGDLPQFVLCVAVNAEGWPVAWEVFPGNTADIEAFQQVISKLRERFRIGRVIVVADRGMISKRAIKLLTDHEEAPFDYILGCRMRRQKEVCEDILSWGGRYQEVAPNLMVKDVRVRDNRYVVCLNPEEATKDAAKRDAILQKLEDVLSRKGAKAVVSNKGYARFLKVRKGGVTINQEAVEADRRFDGKFVLRTNTDLPTAEVAKTYKGLWRVERTFREEKSTLEVRPIFHHRDDTSIGHIVASFLALRLEVDLQARMEKKGIETSWQDLMRDLSQLQAVRMSLDGSNYLIRTDFEGCAYHTFKASGVRPPSRVTKF